MSRIRMVLIAVASVLALGGFVASNAQANGILEGNITGTAAGQTVDCDYSAQYVGSTPSNGVTVTVPRTSFQGRGTTKPCNPASFTLNQDINVTFASVASPPNPGPWRATLDVIDVTDGGSGCTFTAAGSELFGPNSSGAYLGSDSAPGSGPFPCSFLSANLTLSATFTP